MRKLVLVLATIGVLVLVVGSVVPVRGSNIHGSGVNLNCGPALAAMMHWTGPSSPHAGPDIIWADSDIGVSGWAWCELEAGQRMRGVLGLGVILLALVPFTLVLRRAADRARSRVAQ